MGEGKSNYRAFWCPINQFGRILILRSLFLFLILAFSSQGENLIFKDQKRTHINYKVEIDQYETYDYNGVN